jgi:hypothetical protein
MADIFDIGAPLVTDKEWRTFLEDSSRPLVDAPTVGRSQTANFAKQLADAQRDERRATEQAAKDAEQYQKQATKDAERAAKAAAQQSKMDAKALEKAGLPDITEQKQLPLNWFEAKKATGYDQLPYVEQQRIHSDWLDQAEVRIVTADPSKAKTARAELEAKIPTPTKPKAEFGDTDILDKMNVGARSLLEGGARVAASFMDEGANKQSVLQFAKEQEAAKQAARQNYNPETLDAEKMTAMQKQQLIEQHGGEDNIPFLDSLKQGARSMTQGGVVQTIGNIGQSLASSAPTVAGNVMRVAGAGLTATGAGAAVGVPLMAAGTGLATLGGAISTAADVGGDVNEEAIAMYRKQGLSETAARIKAEEATRSGALKAGVIGAIEGAIGAKLGAGAAAKAGIGKAAKQLGVETASDAAAEGAGRAVVNQELIAAGDQRSLTRGVGEAAAQGAIGGIGMGAAGQVAAQVTGAKAPVKQEGPLDTPMDPSVVDTQQTTAPIPAVDNIPALEAAAAAQDALDAAKAKGDPAEIAAAQAGFDAAYAATQNVASQAIDTPAAVESEAIDVEALRIDAETKTAVAEDTPQEDPTYTAVQQAATDAREAYRAATEKIAAQAIDTPAVTETERVADAAITDMLLQIENIGSDIVTAGVSAAPLAGAIGRSEGMLAAQAAKRQWALDIAKGVEPIVAVANDATIEPAQRAAAQAVVAAFEATGTPLPKYETANPPRGGTTGSMSHSNISPVVPGVLKLNRKSAGVATIIHENVHALTVLGLEDMRRSDLPNDMKVLAGLDAIIDFMERHAAVKATKSGIIYAAKNRFELLAESLSGRALPFTSQYTVQDVIDAGELSQDAIDGLMLLTERKPTTLQQLFAKARDYVLKAMGLAAARKGSISDAVLSAQDLAMSRQKSMSVYMDDETLAPGYNYVGKNASGNYATSLSQLVQGLPQKYEGIYTAADGTAIDPNDSLASVASKPAIVELLKAKGFDGFKTEGGETFSLTNNDETPQAKAITAQVANIQRVIVSKRTTNEQRLTYVARFLNGTHDADVMNAINETGVGLTVRAARETQAPWAEALHYGDSDLLQAIATGASDVGQGAAAQARAVLRMYMEAGQDLPKVVKIDGLIPFGDKEAMGQYIPEKHMVELSDLSDPSHAVHEYLHGVTQLGVDAASRSPEGKALKSVMQYMLTSMRTTVVREGDTKPYGLENEHEMMGELFSPSLLSVAARTPIGTPQSKAAQKMIAELMGEKPGTMIQLLDALIRKIVSYLGVKTVPNNMAELLSRVAARAVDETRKAVNDGIAPADALDRPSLFVNDEVLPSGTVPLSMNTLGQTLTGRIAGGDYINNIKAGVNVEPVLMASRLKGVVDGSSKVATNRSLNRLNDQLHDAQGPAKRWIESLPISAAARKRITDLLYLAPGKRDNALADVMVNHGGDAMLKAVAAMAKDGITIETATSWAGHWLTAKHVAEKNAMLVAKRKTAADEAAAVSAQNPKDMRLALAAAKALKAYNQQVQAVESTDLNAGTEQGPAHAAGVAGGMNNAQAKALMAGVEGRIPVAQLQAVAELVYNMNAWRLALDVESGKSEVAKVQGFLNLSDADTLKLQALHDAGRNGTVTEAMRAEVRAIVRSEYVPMTGHPMSSIDGAEAGVFGAGSAQPNSQKNFSMEGRTRGIADNGIATTMSGLVKSATFHGFADFTTGIGEAYDMLSEAQRDAVGIARVDTKGTTRGGDNVILDGRKNNEVSYTIQDPAVLDSIRKANVAEHDLILYKTVGRATRAFAYLVTQANPLFGPKNLLNDAIERSLVLSTRQYFTKSGGQVTVGAMKMIANLSTSFGAVNRLLRGTADYSIEADAALRDLVEAGGMSVTRDVFARDATALAQRVQAAGKGTLSPRGVASAADDWIQKWNKQFDMVSPLASYLALRQAGVEKVDAAGGALDLMNFRKKGAAMGNISQIYAFAQPAVTGGANMLGMLKTKKGMTIAATSLIGFAALQALAEAGADEDEGGNKLRQLPDYMRNQNLNVQVGSYVVSIPLGFGATRLAKTVGRVGSDMVYKDRGVGESLVDIVKEGLVPALLPIEDTKIKDPIKKLAFELSPTVARPFAALALNVDSQGNQIDREKWIDSKVYRHMQGSKTIAPEYRSLAETVFNLSGGQLDLTPEATKTLVQGYSVGLFKTLVAETITNPHRESQGKETAPFILGSLVSPVAKPLNEDAWKGQVRKAQEELDELQKQEAKLEAAKTPEARIELRELQRTPEYKLLKDFEEFDKRLRAENAATTRSLNKGQITEKAAAARKEAVREKRSVEEAKFLVKWRKAKGLTE